MVRLELTQRLVRILSQITVHPCAADIVAVHRQCHLQQLDRIPVIAVGQLKRRVYLLIGWDIRQIVFGPARRPDSGIPVGYDSARDTVW